MGASSIVERVSHSSVTGLELGIDVHSHYDKVYLFWNTLHIVECYCNGIKRYSLDIQCTRGVRMMFKHFGLTGRCSCTYVWNPDLGKTCIFSINYTSARHLTCPPITSTCRCRISGFWGTTDIHYITSFSLKNSQISTAYTRRFPTYDDLMVY
jgi:hypothetical protein